MSVKIQKILWNLNPATCRNITCEDYYWLELGSIGLAADWNYDLRLMLIGISVNWGECWLKCFFYLLLLADKYSFLTDY